MAVALITDALTTLVELKRHMGISGSSDDDILNQLINGASVSIESYIGRKLVSQTYTDEEHDGNGTQKLYLVNWPIISVTNLKLWDKQTDTVQDTFTENTDFVLYAKEGYLYKWGGYSKGIKNYRSTYVAGYASLPEDVKMGCNKFCSQLFDTKRKEGIKSHKIGTFGETFGGVLSKEGIFELPPDIQAIFSKYRSPYI